MTLVWKMIVTGVAAASAATSAFAQDASDAAASGPLEELIVTGTRAPDRTAAEAAVPVHVISGEKLRTAGYPDLARALQTLEPSLNFPRPQTTPTAANTRAITLRGLSPDEVLVLVNGKRWHPTAVINTNFAVGRGSAPFDLSTIPLVAIDRVEVLRDGAAAQYGSDAIAGVVNILLKSNRSGGTAALTGGVTDRGDGESGSLALNQGFSFADAGRITVSGAVEKSNPTNRAAIDQRYGRMTFRIGDPESLTANLALSMAYPLPWAGGEWYDDLLVSRKDSANTPNFRPPGTSPLYPNGYLPEVNPAIWDAGNTLGIRGTPGGFEVDLSNTFGYSNARFTVRDTANVLLGAASPTSFDSGTVRYWQDVTNLNVGRQLPDVLAGAHVAAGLEHRYEAYSIGAGEPNSYLGTGADGFPGFNPRIAVDESRNASGAFVDVEIKPWSAFSINAAGRYDHYDDFGGATTWKTSLRFDVTEWLALRASASTGFRAPSLQQQYYSSITSVANGANKSFVNVGTYQVRDPIAQALGAMPLRPEKSRDESAGIVLRPTRALAFTLDVFRTDITNRIALSDALSGPAVAAVLAQAGVSNVQQVAFFTNALNTRTQGYDATLQYSDQIGSNTHVDLSLGFERTPTTVRALAPNAALPSLALIGVHAQALLAQAQPQSKLTSRLAVERGPLTGAVTVTRYGEYVDAPILDPQTFGAKTLVDLSLGARLNEQLSLDLGVLNVGDVFPDPLAQAELAFRSFGGSYVYGEESPFGVAGRSYFLRMLAQF